MASEPIHALLGLFDTEAGASGALASLRDQSTTIDRIQHAAVLRADQAGKLRISEMDNMAGRKGGPIDGVTGGVIGLLGSAIVLPLAIRAVIGGMAATLCDSGYRNGTLSSLGTQIQLCQSVLVMAARSGDVTEQLPLASGASVVREAVGG